ncbi:hypothetical protein GCM10008961_13700 [Deinococcus knuensis]|uniref:DUF447 family protein n=1 Tax=Deinococcus knuensis TaxID=1837380 RepID=A0ABQ2SGC2_9DEIO|nr:hypothetical protein GCM10008961_13700 [Deinococcus knuensis]
MIGQARIRNLVIKSLKSSVEFCDFKVGKNFIIHNDLEIEHKVVITSGKFKHGICIRVELQNTDPVIEDFLCRHNLTDSTGRITSGLELDQVNPTRDLPQGYWLLDQNYESFVRSIIDDVVSFGLPYFSMNNSRVEIYNILVKDNAFSWINQPRHYERGIRLICMAIALGRTISEIKTVEDLITNRIKSSEWQSADRFRDSIERILKSSAELHK